ncbi:MAG: hypothetical protein HYT30_01345 [Parcubacteria group bacterium]|nr:hypothetical protein [Parcubacteria group bacterium]
MDTSVYIAQLVGPVLLTVGIAMFIRPQAVPNMIQTLVAGQGELLTFFLGMCAMLAGIAIVLSHNIWEASWRGIITILGWGMIIKGIVRILVPEWALRTSGMVSSNTFIMKCTAFVLFLIGLYLSYRGFVV